MFVSKRLGSQSFSESARPAGRVLGQRWFRCGSVSGKRSTAGRMTFELLGCVGFQSLKVLEFIDNFSLWIETGP